MVQRHPIIKVAKDILIHPRNSQLIKWIGLGPSIRARARLAFLVALLTATLTLLVGVLRTFHVSDTAKSLGAYEQFTLVVTEARLSVEQLRSSFWRLEVQAEPENQREMSLASKKMEDLVGRVLREAPRDFNWGDPGLDMALSQAVSRWQTVETAINARSLPLLRQTIVNLSETLEKLSQLLAHLNHDKRQETQIALTQNSRDELLLFLLLLFCIPVFVGIVPTWLVAPMMRLKVLAHYVETGRVHEVEVLGDDEVSRVARVIKNVLSYREDVDRKKSAKIFEIRNVLRMVIQNIEEPVLIVARDTKINYANFAAAKLLGVETHHLEGSGLAQYVCSRTILEAVQACEQGDVQDFADVSIDLASGPVRVQRAQVRAVRNREGQVSRIVIVFHYT